MLMFYHGEPNYLFSFSDVFPSICTSKNMHVGIFEESYGIVAIKSVAYGTQLISQLYSLLLRMKRKIILAYLALITWIIVKLMSFITSNDVYTSVKCD